jgi:hypothetical protein
MKTRTTTKVFELIPSVQTRKQSPGPITFIPALPIRLEAMPTDVVHYAVVDTAAKISMISAALVPTALIDISEPTTAATATEGLRIVKFSITLCDVEFSPWLQLREVPFTVLPGREPTTQSSIVLGVDACLSRLRLDIDFPRKKLRVTAPSALIESLSKGSKAEIPSRIKQGEELIKLGSYDSAIALIVAGLEEAIVPMGERGQGSHGTWTYHYEHILPIQLLDQSMRKALNELSTIRNQAVHGSRGDRISEEQARHVLEIAKGVLKRLAKFKEQQLIS